MTKKRLMLLLLLLSPVVLGGQSDVTVGPVAAGNVLTWTQVGVSAADAQSVLTYMPSVDGKAMTSPLAAGSITCAGSPAVCRSTPFPQPLLDALNIVGTHELRLVAIHPTGGPSGQSLPFVLRTPTAAPGSLRIVTQ